MSWCHLLNCKCRTHSFQSLINSRVQNSTCPMSWCPCARNTSFLEILVLYSEAFAAAVVDFCWFEKLTNNFSKSELISSCSNRRLRRHYLGWILVWLHNIDSVDTTNCFRLGAKFDGFSGIIRLLFRFEMPKRSSRDVIWYIGLKNKASFHLSPIGDGQSEEGIKSFVIAQPIAMFVRVASCQQSPKSYTQQIEQIALHCAGTRNCFFFLVVDEKAKVVQDWNHIKVEDKERDIGNGDSSYVGSGNHLSSSRRTHQLQPLTVDTIHRDGVSCLSIDRRVCNTWDNSFYSWQTPNSITQYNDWWPAPPLRATL